MRIRTTLAAAALLLTAPALARAGDLDDARALRDAGKWKEALAKYEKAAEADPQSADAALGVSEALCALGKYELGAKALTPALLEAQPDNVTLRVAKARAYLLRAAEIDREGGDPQAIMGYCGDADRWIKQALEKDPKSPEGRVLKAKVLQFQGGSSTPEAISLLESVAADNPATFDAHWELGVAAMNAARADNKNKSKWAKAEKHFRDAFGADAKSGQALLQATYAKQWQGVAPAAEMVGDYEKCARLLPGDVAPVVQILKTRKWAAAEVKAALGRLSGKDGHPRAKAFAEALDAEAAAAAGKGKEAVAAVERAVEAWGDGPPQIDFYWVLLLTANAAGTEGDQKEKVWTVLWKKWPERFEAANNAGLYNRDVTHDYKRSAEWYERAAPHAAASPQVLNDTGLIYHYHLGKNDVAEKWFRKALAAAEENGIDPWQAATNVDSMGYRDALNNLAKVLREEKRWKDLGKFVEDHVPEGWPGREQWAQMAESGGK